MAALKFDTRGNLKPYERIKLTIDEFENFFITDFGGSKTRKLIYENYIDYVFEIQSKIDMQITQWIDGSFVTRKLNPNDIDIVTFIDYNIYESKEDIIRTDFNKYFKRYAFPFVDAYTVKNYPKNHKREWVTKNDKIYWLNLFSKTKVNRANKAYQKGFIEINYG